MCWWAMFNVNNWLSLQGKTGPPVPSQRWSLSFENPCWHVQFPQDSMQDTWAEIEKPCNATSTKQEKWIVWLHWPADEEELPYQSLPSHSHEDVTDGHAFTETRHHSGFGQVGPQSLQQPVEALLSSIAPDFAWRKVMEKNDNRVSN